MKTVFAKKHTGLRRPRLGQSDWTTDSDHPQKVLKAHRAHRIRRTRIPLLRMALFGKTHKRTHFFRGEGKQRKNERGKKKKKPDRKKKGTGAIFGGFKFCARRRPRYAKKKRLESLALRFPFLMGTKKLNTPKKEKKPQLPPSRTTHNTKKKTNSKHTQKQLKKKI